eukprot:COSAG02_NODE_1399_length_12852_cov_83.666745_4_plen_93_part_00
MSEADGGGAVCELCCGSAAETRGAPKPIKGAFFELQIEELDLSLEHADGKRIGIEAVDEISERRIQDAGDDRLKHGSSSGLALQEPAPADHK